MIAKIIVYDASREGAIRRMDTALRDTVILGTTTNLRFLRSLLNHPVFQGGEVDTGFIERHLSELVQPAGTPPDEALIAAALAEMHTASHKQTNDHPTDPWGQPDTFRIGAKSW